MGEAYEHSSIWSHFLLSSRKHEERILNPVAHLFFLAIQVSLAKDAFSLNLSLWKTANIPSYVCVQGYMWRGGELNKTIQNPEVGIPKNHSRTYIIPWNEAGAHVFTFLELQLILNLVLLSSYTARVTSGVQEYIYRWRDNGLISDCTIESSHDLEQTTSFLWIVTVEQE